MKTIGDATPASIEAAAKHAQTPQPDQQIPLSTYRVTSSIPKPSNETKHSATASDDESQPTNNNSSDRIPLPVHQPSQGSKWVYPSEQQFFNAMKRKGWEIPAGMESAIPHVVQIHNAVNERGWREVLKWESDRGNKNPRLVKFIGRPKDLSPRARFYSMLWLRNEPFDRHDWIVDRGDGSGERRYVIDFYNGKEDLKIQGVAGNENGDGNGNGLPSMYLDVRPALDDMDSAQDRVKMFCKDAFPGIAGLMNSGSGNGSASADSAR